MSDIDTGTDLHRLVERASQLVPFGGVRSIEVLDAVDGFARIEYVGDRSIFNVQEASAFLAHAVLEELTARGYIVSIRTGWAYASTHDEVFAVRDVAGIVEPLLELLTIARERRMSA